MEQKKNAGSDAPKSRELTSWKEIAHHLGVNVRTAQKWERERALPVSRTSGSRSRVSADTLALDAWKKGITQVSNQEDRCYRWPLAANVTAEVRFVGRGLVTSHIDLVCEYLALFKTALH